MIEPNDDDEGGVPPLMIPLTGSPCASGGFQATMPSVTLGSCQHGHCCLFCSFSTFEIYRLRK